MVLQNYCYNCGKRVMPDEEVCSGCGSKTLFKKDYNNVYVFTPPVHNIGFFNFSIDFSPYIVRKGRKYKYSICSCGFINHSDYSYCSMCGKKAPLFKKSRFIKENMEAQGETVVCECGTVNITSNNFCEMCGRKLYQDEGSRKDDYYANFSFEYSDPVFCNCGEENDSSNKFCSSCGTPLNKFPSSNEFKILCICGEVNSISSKYCMGCGIDLEKEVEVLSCVCGAKNSSDSEYCSVCQRPLNPKRSIRSKKICKCGSVLNYGDEYCPYCGRNIRRSIFHGRFFR